MMQLILIVLFCTISMCNPAVVEKKITLIEEGDQFTIVCDNPLAQLTLGGTTVAHCEKCPSSKCNVDEDYKERITAFCREENSIFHFNSTRISDNRDPIRCTKTDLKYFYLIVGKSDAHLHSENNSTFALNQENFTLVCDKNRYGYIDWLNKQGKRLSTFSPECTNKYSNYDTKKFNITCDKKQEKTKLLIKNVTLVDDGKLFGCQSRWRPLYVFKLNVNVPVNSVSIVPLSKVLFENEDGIFVCKVEKSKPEASFQWIIVYQDGSAQNIQQKYTAVSKTLKGKLWQTNSTLRLKLKRNFQKIMCKATIENLPWTNSDFLSLDIKNSLARYTKIPTYSTVPDTKIYTDSAVPGTNFPIGSLIHKMLFSIITVLTNIITIS